jgi:hypothetical protein
VRAANRDGLLGAAVSNAVAAHAPVDSHIGQLVALAFAYTQENGNFSPDTADIRPDPLGLRIDVDADDHGGMTHGTM